MLLKLIMSTVLLLLLAVGLAFDNHNQNSNENSLAETAANGEGEDTTDEPERDSDTADSTNEEDTSDSIDEGDSNMNEEEDANEEDSSEEDSIQTVANPESITAMVNKSYSLPEGYRPSDLVRPDVSFVFGDEDVEKALLREVAATALEDMFSDAQNVGIHLFAASGFRSSETQSFLFDRQVEQDGYDQDAVAPPGTSEHQTGLAMDITAASVDNRLTESFGETAEGIWLEENAHKHGFILRYPKGKEEITEYMFEPWHFRYVGIEMATEMFEKGLTFEEFNEEIGEV